MQPITLTLATDAGRGDPTFVLLEDLAQSVTEASGGALAITLFGAGELIGAFEVFDAVTAGQIDMGWSIAGASFGQYPAYGAFDLSLGAAPGTDDSEAAYEVIQSDELDIFGLDYLATAFFGSTILATNAAIESPDDLVGLKLRAAGINGAVLGSELGVNVVNLPGSELFAAVSTGVIDGAFGSSVLIQSTGLIDATENVYSDPEGRFLGPVLRMLTINSDSRADLPAELAAILAQETGAALSRAWGERVAEIYATALEESGAMVQPLSPAVLDAYEAAVDRYVETSVDPIFERFADAFAEARGTSGPPDPVIRGTEDPERLDGTRGNDTILAFEGDDDLRGGGGVDVLRGGPGGDTLRAAPGSTLDGGPGSDLFLALGGAFTIIEAEDAPGLDTLRTDRGYAPIPGLERVELVGDRNLRIDGSCASETFLGNGGNNLIVGFGGEDTVTGGSGADTFAFYAPDDNVPVMIVTDFNASEGDRLALDDNLLGLGGPRIDTRELTVQEFRDARDLGTVAYRRSEGEIRVDIDGRDGPEAFAVVAKLEPGTRLTLDDILLF